MCGQGCPRCNISVGELEIMKILDYNNIKYKHQYYFSDLKNMKKLYYDFAILDDNNILCLLEYNGEQHYIYNPFFHKSINGFKLSQHRDSLKYNYCIENKIPLEIIKYNDNIVEKINSILKYYHI